MEFGVPLLLLLFSSSLLLIPSAQPTLLGNETDRLALLAFRDRISDPLVALSSWSDSIHFCEWAGVSCGRKHPERVTALNLSSSGLAGPLSPSIANLTFVETVLLSGNGFYGEIPPEIGRLRRLQILDLGINSFHGGIPANLTYCSALRTLDLDGNMLAGRIPDSLSSLSNLGSLYLSNNSLTGAIPASLANLSALAELAFRSNYLEGSIPGGLGGLTKLQYLQLSGNRLSGIVPPPLFNLSSLNYFGLAANMLQGRLPPSMGTALPNLQTLLLGGNQFTGAIPPSLSNASGFFFIDVSYNKLSGQVPPDLGRLAVLTELNLESNQLEASDAAGWEFLTSLSNCSELFMLSLFDNNLTGALPDSVANLSTKFQELRMGVNQISGSIPSGIENLVNLVSLTMERNLLTGMIPPGIGKLGRLQQLNLYHNQLVGSIPSSIGNITQLASLLLSYNQLTGPIPSSLGDLRSLIRAGLGHNGLNGTMPKEIFTFPSMDILSLLNNDLVGPLPAEVGRMNNLRVLSVAGNRLSGEIPSALSNCVILEVLEMGENSFEGSIPPSLGTIKGLQELGLEQNNLSGPIPESLQNLALVYLNLSFNHLDGKVPMNGVFENATAISLIGNHGLCGGIHELQLPVCPIASSDQKRRRSPLLKIVIPTASAALGLVLISFIVIVYWRQKSRKEPPSLPSFEDGYPKVSYTDLAKATDGFSPANLIGAGSFGSVYKCSLDHGDTTIAVKVFNLLQHGASKSFVAECDALRCIRHRNLVKILTACSSVDSQGADFKALVFEFMPNGSLETWLHVEEGRHHELRNLSLLQRLSIAIDVADALDYLHHDCETPVVHCDLKPSNVLLDDSMSAHVGDFGLARLLPDAMSRSLQDFNSWIGIRGSIGYVPPEYGVGGQVSTSGDVYSFGILLLEMFTGRRPVDDMFKDGLNLRSFVEAAFPDRVTEIADPPLLLGQDGSIDDCKGSGSREGINNCLVSVLKVGLTCSNPSPKERMNMREISNEMHGIRDVYLRIGFMKDMRC